MTSWSWTRWATEKTALFLIMSDTDDSVQLPHIACATHSFSTCCAKRRTMYTAAGLPVHVRCLIDECANIGQIPNLEKLIATIRSREISACLVLQAQSQLKALYKDNADTIMRQLRQRDCSSAAMNRRRSRSCPHHSEKRRLT